MQVDGFCCLWTEPGKPFPPFPVSMLSSANPVPAVSYSIEYSQETQQSTVILQANKCFYKLTYCALTSCVTEGAGSYDWEREVHRSKPVSELQVVIPRLCRKVCAGSESDASVSRLWLHIFVTLLMSLDGACSRCLALRLLHSSHLLNRKCLCSSGGMCLLILQLQPQWFEAMCPETRLLPCRALQPQKCLTVWNVNDPQTAVVADNFLQVIDPSHQLPSWSVLLFVCNKWQLSFKKNTLKSQLGIYCKVSYLNS